MLRSLNEITGYSLHAIDDQIGYCKDFLFDDQFWTVRYMITDTNTWLPKSKKTLISLVSSGEPDWDNNKLPIRPSRDSIKKSPLCNEHKPVSREYEKLFFDYYDYNYYWMGVGACRSYAAPIIFGKAHSTKSVSNDEQLTKTELIKEGHLRSAKEIKGYMIKATDSAFCHVKDFILNDIDWSICYIFVDTYNWIPGSREVLLAPNRISSVSWIDQTVCINLSSKKIKNSSLYDPKQFVDPEYDNVMHDFYINLNDN